MLHVNLKNLFSAVAEIFEKFKKFKSKSFLTYFCIAYFVLLTIYLRAKFEAYSFNVSNLFTAVRKFEM